jgi:hypothetical protein
MEEMRKNARLHSAVCHQPDHVKTDLSPARGVAWGLVFSVLAVCAIWALSMTVIWLAAGVRWLLGS